MQASLLILLMLSIKSEDGKVLEVDRSKFQELTNVIENAKNTFSIQDDSCLITEPVNGSSVGTLVSSFKTIGNYQEISYSLLDSLKQTALKFVQPTVFVKSFIKELN